MIGPGEKVESREEFETDEFLNDDEYLEVTPKNIRIRKKILDHSLRAKARGRAEEID